MIKQIQTLTDAQRARFPEFVRRWTDIGLCTDPADRPRAEAAIVRMYAQANLAAPRVVWCGSPLSQGLTRATVAGAALPPAAPPPPGRARGGRAGRRRPR